MPDYLNKKSREHIAAFLPNALSKALHSYHEFIDSDIPTDSKGFAAYHSAAKIAISHVELLMKMAKSSAPPPKEIKDNDGDISSMIARAEMEVKSYKKRQGNKGNIDE